MSLPDPPGVVDAPEWPERLLVVLQFALLAVMGGRAWLATPSGRAAALVLFVAAIALAVWSLSANRPGNFNIRPTPRDGGTLVTHGPYQWIRHPMYTSVLMAAGAAASWSLRVADFVLWAALLGVLLFKAQMEERALVQRFPGYQHYMARTKRFLPWVA